MSLIKIIHFVKTLFNFNIVEVRQAWRAGVVSISALLINNYWLKTNYPLWILFTAVVCLQANFGAALRKSRQRIVGTILGSTVAFLIAYLFPDQYIYFVLIIILTLIFWFWSSTGSYTYTVFFMTLAVMMLYFSLFTNDPHFAILRVEDVVCGALLSSLSLLFIWPEFARKNFIKDLSNANLQLNEFFIVILQFLDHKTSIDSVYNQKNASSECIQIARNRLREIFYELGIEIVSNRFGGIFYKNEIEDFPLQKYESLVILESRIHYDLLTLYNALLLEYFENRKENFPFYKEKLEILHQHFQQVVKKIPLGKKKINSLLEEKNSINMVQEEKAHFVEDKTSPSEVKLFSYFNKLFYEIEVMQEAVKKLGGMNL